MSKEKYWYTLMPEGEGDIALRVKQVLKDDIKLKEVGK